uniref:Uncharacterized protein n=1 Tax=Salvator merianae TaxID=96440 RepID=A0A8D0DRR3_SALMN
MNGAVDYLLSEEVVNFSQQSSSLAFNIVGGTDQQYISNDTGIYVCRIKPNEAAALDRQLRENMLCNNVVEFFRNVGDNVSLKAAAPKWSLKPPGEGEPGGFPFAVILLPGLFVAAAALWAFLRYRQWNHCQL